MTEIVVARRNGVIREPDGTAHRIHRGKTLAHADHPIVTNVPDAWMPMTVELTTPGPQDTEQSQADHYREQLSEIADVLDEYGFAPVDQDSDGWLVKAVRETLEELAGPEPVAPAPTLDEPGAQVQPPKAPARKRTPPAKP
jgi:hypothetical protein